MKPGRLSPDLRNAFDAFLASALGTLAGILVDSGFGVRDAIANIVYELLGPLFDLFSAFPNGQLVVAGFIYRMPVVLIVGLATGMILRHIRYRRLLLCSVLVWLVYLVARSLLAASPSPIGDPAGKPPASHIVNAIPGIAGYLMQYAFLILVIRATDGVLARSARRKGPER